MALKFITQYSAWLILPLLLGAAAIAFFFYYRDNKLTDVKLWKIRLMMLLRFLVLFITGLLLLGPMVKSTKRLVEKPVILFAQDNSSSLLYSADSSFMINEWPRRIEDFGQTLKNQFDFRLYAFGNTLARDTSIDYSATQTDFSRLFAQINNNYSGKNIGAVIVASDGIYTQGANPVYASSVADYPVYSIALGDTTPRPDVAITDLQTNKITYLGNEFPLRIYLNATQLKNQNLVLKILHEKEEVYSQDIQPDSRDFNQVIDTRLEASEIGNQTYTVMIQGVDQEQNTMNNQRQFVIEVIDNKQKILLLARAPHPDIGALQNTLKQIRSYELTYKRIDEFTGNLAPYNLLILHQLPDKTHSLSKILKQNQEDAIPRLFIGGAQSNWAKLSEYAGGLKVEPGSSTMEQAYPAANEKFSVYRITEEMQEFLKIVPPLNAPFGKYTYRAPYEVLAFQKLKNIETAKPLIAIANAHDQRPKTGIIAGTGLWHWRMYDYIENKTHRNFDEFINKMVQFLALKAKKEHISVDHSPVFSENENIYFEVQVYNEIYELVEDAEVNMQITGEDGKQYDFTLSTIQTNTGVMYVLNAGIFPEGSYKYTITADIGDREYEKQGEFKVMPVQIEMVNTKANHRVLYQLANQNQGDLYTPETMDALTDTLQNNKAIQSVVHTDDQLLEIIHWKWIFLVLLAFLAAEWFFRKFEGSY